MEPTKGVVVVRPLRNRNRNSSLHQPFSSLSRLVQFRGTRKLFSIDLEFAEACNLQSKMFPAYFTLVGSCCAISLSVFGYLHPWKSSSAVEKYQLGFLLSAFPFNLTNLFVFTPMTIDMMKQRHKVERENNIGDEVGWSKIPRIHLSPEIPLSELLCPLNE